MDALQPNADTLGSTYDPSFVLRSQQQQLVLDATLMLAAGDPDLPPSAVRDALANGANPNYQNDSGVSPLHLAGRWGHAEQIRALARAGARLEIKTAKYNETPLHWAARFGNAEAVLALVDMGASLAAVDGLGCTPWAAFIKNAVNIEREDVERMHDAFAQIEQHHPDRSRGLIGASSRERSPRTDTVADRAAPPPTDLSR
ncbi:ankyrin repeat domain-containing protein [Burkholderia pseudomallei]|uniref:ankyrin repeat domain-containing protein n=1 Tax=Burkholderia pseudomallei TaxID=28450 RepID=UPI000F087F62|nr:ankyrin repeat domain-containing protein [Burkholderia pseudomallei]CAJ3070165.1 ankyrin [Burkholderia pseudomallei]VCK73003.1 ankyrin [Burkholderia pseudomallei]VCK79887.1 ankyrin [Burkholderia pseudomallei]VCK80135.1 ankyrin [Burkholderia pseudomallei]VCK80890.1 ankyrin [Burkholderia pseudomallei]